MEWNGPWADDTDEINKHQERIEETLGEKYAGTHEKVNVNQNDGCFLMCFEDFLRVYNKLFICINFPPSYVGFRAHGKWIVGKESGGLPLTGSQPEWQSFFKNPQYYLQINNFEGKNVYISLLQDDGRLLEPKFPFPNSVKKACLIICKVNSKNRVEQCVPFLSQTPISQRRDISLEVKLDKGEYVIMPCTMYGKDGGNYCLEIFLEDNCNDPIVGRSAEPPQFDNCAFEKLGGIDCEYELITEGTPSQMQKVEQDKKDFMMAQLKKCLTADDTQQYGSEIDEEEKENMKYDEY